MTSRLAVRPTIAALSLLLLLLAACGQRGMRSPLGPLDRAARLAEDGRRGAETLSLAGWHAWLVHGDAAKLEALSLKALEDDERAAWAWMGLAEVERRRVQADAEAKYLLALLENAPSHPLAPLAARRLRALAGVSLPLDELLLEVGERLLREGKLDGEAASHLREALLALYEPRSSERYLSLASEAGRMSEVALVGPMRPFSNLQFFDDEPPFQAGPIEDVEGRELRTLRIPDGAIELGAEPADGDVYHALSVVTAPRAGRYLVRLDVAPTSNVSLFLDGIPVFERRSFGKIEPTSLLREVELKRGEHLLSLRLGRGRGRGEARVEIAPADGSPSQLRFRAAKVGDRAMRGGVRLLGPHSRSSQRMANALHDEVGILAGWAGGRMGLGNDPEGARRLLDGAVDALPGSAPLLALRAAALQRDPSIPQRVSVDRALSDLRQAVAKDPGYARALLRLASLQRQAGRWDEAEEALDQAEEAVGPEAVVLLERSRLAGARGFQSLAGALAREAYEGAPRHCQVGARAYDTATNLRDADARLDIATKLAFCPGGQRRLFRLHLDAGNPKKAREIVESWAAITPDAQRTGFALAEVHLAAGRPMQAAEAVARLGEIWPRTQRLARLEGDYLAKAGEVDRSREARLRALELDGSDLSLLLFEAFERRLGILEEWDPDAMEAIAAFEARGDEFDAPAVTLIDFVGIEVHGDGSQVERVHTLTKVLDKRGIDLVGEAHLPDDAHVLELRTIKEDGSYLEPEHIGAKDSISLPGLEVGDYVEIQYLHTRSGRGAGLPGWSSPRFFFRTRDIPIIDSLFVVRADKRLGLEVDAHQGPPVGEVIDEGTHLLYVARSKDNPAFIPEPGAVASQEILPWVQVGAGAGEKELASFVADSLLGASRLSAEVEKWAKDAASGAANAEEAIALVWERLMEEIDGGGSFETPASFILTNKRGNRAVLLKAALDALGIENAWVALRTFQHDPSPYRFPHQSRFGHFVLVARPDPRGGWVWLDPSTRYARVGELHPDAQGTPGWVLPGPSGSEALPTTSPLSPPPSKKSSFRLEVREDGSLVGEGTETHAGLGAARARAALERSNEESLRQAVESSLAKGFRGASLLEVGWEVHGEEVSVSYTFEVSQAVVPLGDGTVALELDFTHANLGQRFLGSGKRETPLLIAYSSQDIVETEIVLPADVEIVSAPEAARERGDHGHFRRGVAVVDKKVVIRDILILERGRVQPHDYPAFVSWATAVDSALSDELILRKAAPPPSPDPAPADPETAPEDEPLE